MKIIGIIFIILAAAGISHAIRRSKKMHIAMLYEIRRSFVEIADEMAISMRPVSDILRRISAHYCQELKATFENIAEKLSEADARAGREIWHDAFFRMSGALMLDDEESEVVMSAGASFFGTSVEANKAGALHAIALIDEKIAEAKERRARDEKLYGMLCMSGAFALILIFL
jgi:stage III sporulation protein AB